MYKNNKGLSLVELIIAIAIFSIAGAAVCAFMIFGTRQFTNSTSSVKLQYEQQLVVNRVRDIILETSRGISHPDANTLIVFSDNPDYKKDAPTPDPAATTPPTSSPNQCLVTEIRFEESTDEEQPGKLFISKPITMLVTEDTDFDSVKGLSFDEIEVTDSLKAFEVVDFEKNLELNKVELKMVFKVRNKEVTVNPTIALRNNLSKVEDGTSLNDVYKPAAEELEIFSPISKVEIARDGKIFAQSKTDTIKLAGDGETTSVQYEAIVTKKKTYKEAIDPSVTWSIDESTVVKPGYENCISISENGMVTVQKWTDSEGTIHRPDEYINGNYFIIVATSNQSIKEGNPKSARLRIKLDIGGVYPKEIVFDGDPVKTEDKVNGLAVYKFANIITYTGLIEDPLNPGSMVNTLSGESAYTKLTYRVDTTKGAIPPAGAGFSTTGKVDGTFIVTKEMEEKTYCVVATVNQRDQKGELVYAEYMLNVPKGAVPVIDPTITMPILSAPETALRGSFTALSVRWSQGVPTYKEKDSKKENVYEYSFDWEIEAVESNWGKDENRDKFSNLVYFQNHYREQKLTGNKAARVAMIWVEPTLNWEKSFMYRVKVYTKINGNNKSGYYRLPGSDPSDPENIFASDPSDAYVLTQIVKIDPVTLSLTPVEAVIYENDRPFGYQDNNSLGNTSFSPNTTIYLSEPYTVKWKDSNRKNREDNIIATAYCKVFEPEFTGISINLNNYNKNIKRIKDNLSDGKSSLQTYTEYSSGGSKYIKYQDARNGGDYSNAYKVNTSNQGGIQGFYFFLRMFPNNWQVDSTGSTDKKPNGARWICIVEDDAGNSVRATFKPDNADSMNYKFIYENKK